MLQITEWCKIIGLLSAPRRRQRAVRFASYAIGIGPLIPSHADTHLVRELASRTALARENRGSANLCVLIHHRCRTSENDRGAA